MARPLMLCPARVSTKRKYFAFRVFLMVQYYVFFCVSRCRRGVGPRQEKNNKKTTKKQQKNNEKNNEKTTKKQRKNNEKTTKKQQKTTKNQRKNNEKTTK